MIAPRSLLALLGLVACAAPSLAQGEVAFERHELSDVFFCEGASFADLDRDGHGDVIAGPYWYAGPDFEERHEIYAPKPFDPLGYSDNFFAWPRDFDGDEWVDVLFVGFPGQDASWYENPGEGGGAWERHRVFDVVDNEAPAFADLTGDGREELVFHTGGRFGFAGPGAADPREPWTFTPISEDIGLPKFVHGLGVGDVNGDGRPDLLWKDGWWEHPAGWDRATPWRQHRVDFAAGRRGGAQMFTYDVDGDGDADVITSLDGHGHGLSWFEQTVDGGFAEHRIMDAAPEDNSHGVTFSELHALDLVDVDRDGLMDVVTGKRWWAHGPKGDPDTTPPAVLYWFELVRGDEGAAYVPHLIDDRSGVGVQVVAGDVDGDGRADVVVGNKQGAFVFLQRTDESVRVFDFEGGDLAGWTAEGAAFAGQPVRGDTVTARGREASRHEGTYWIGGYELHGDEPQGTLTSKPVRVTHPWASFLVGGGAYDGTRVEIERDGEEIFRVSGADYESMQRVVVDLRPHVGREIVVRLVDRASGGWGHVNFDDFRFHPEEPRFEQDPSLPEVLPLDRVSHAGLAPEEAARAMTVPAGFRVDVIAAEPDLHQPIAFTLDHKGRIWVAEAYSYPERRPEGEGRDTILVLEDADGDGSFETRTTFAGDLNLVSGLEVGFGGVWVGAAPYLLFIPDADDDLVPDGPPEVLLDGWGYQDTHETLNAFIWGPDGWLYGCHGVFTHSRVGKPGTPDAERVPINAGVWRYHPQRHEFEVFAWGSSNPWGVDFDDKGQAFITACVIPHAFHVVQGGRYHRQAGSHFNPYVYDDIGTIVDHRHYLGPTPHGGNLRSNAAGGGHAHCGAMIYQGDSFPDEYRGALFMNNIHGNRVNVDRLEHDGAGFVASHADDFLLANDKWFRGISLKYAADGSVYLIDWYDEQACHLNDTEIWDRGNGRLYRVSYGEPRNVSIDLRSLPDEELVRLQLHDNEFLVRRARIALQERSRSEEAQETLVGLLRELYVHEEDEGKQLRLLWAWNAVGGLSEDMLVGLTRSRHDYVSAWAVQLLAEDGELSWGAQSALAVCVTDRSPVVRLYVAAALQRLPPEERKGLAGLLAAVDPDEHRSLPYLIWYGMEPAVALDPEWALRVANETWSDQLQLYIVRRLAEEADGREVLVRALEEENRIHRGMILVEMEGVLRERRNVPMPAAWPDVFARLVSESDTDMREVVMALAASFGDPAAFPELRATLADAGAEREARERALETLLAAKDADTPPILHGLIDEEGFRGPALRALAGFDHDGTPAVILARYGGFDAGARRDALNTLSARPAFARELLRAVERSEIARDDLGAFVVRKLDNLGDPEVAELLASAWGKVRATSEDAEARVGELKHMLASAGPPDLANGRDVFARTCQQCHTLFETGGDLGPDITGSNRADRDYILRNLVDPSAEVGLDYMTTMVWLADESLATGLLWRETDDTLTLRTENDTIVVAKADVDERRLSELSTMPDGLLDALGDEEIRDLVGYLASEHQVPRRATPDNLHEFFDGESLAGWTGNLEVWSVVDGGIVGKTDGLPRNEFLRSAMELSDFRLTFEARLAGDQGNSGVQFRSRELEHGEVAGYQADIGPGWWGKLYEEHGRAVLWDRSGESHVVRDGWNTYEILAVGSRIQTRLNGELCVDLDDPAGARSGIVALQVHSGGPTEIRFRAFRLELDPPSPPPVPSDR